MKVREEEMEGSPKSVDARAQELAARCQEKVREYRPSMSERRQDWLMNQLARNPDLKSRLLQFVDVLAALESAADSGRVKRLFREYLGGKYTDSSWLLRFALSAACNRLTPAWFVAGVSRRQMRSLARRFIATPGSELRILTYLEKLGRYASLDLVGEEVLSEHEAEEFKERYLQLIDRIAVKHGPAGRGHGLQLSIRLTSLTGDFNPVDPEGTLSRVRGRLEEIANHCVEKGISLTVDAERFQFRETIWHIFSRVFGRGSRFADWAGAGLAVQAYLKDSEDHLRTVLQLAEQRGAPLQVRLVKGAYWDYEVMIARQNRWPVPVFERKGDTDLTFQNILETLLRNSRHVALAVGSHNVGDHARAEALRRSLDLAPDAVEHQVLFRTAEGLSRALTAMGWATRDYVPSGELVPGMSYLVRRILENTSLEGFLLRSRSGGELPEINREAHAAPPQDDAGSPFHNTPPKRLFLASERSPFEQALEEASAQWGQEYPVKLGGRMVQTRDIKESLSPSKPDRRNPVGRMHMAGISEAQEAITVARRGFARWSETPADERARVLIKAAEHLARQRDALAAWIVQEGGRTWAEALADVDEAVDHFAYNSHRLLACEKRVQEQFQPRGVVAVISPWNFPAALPCGMISGALAAGNSVILKSAEQTPVIAARLVDALHSGGVPDDVLVHVAGWGEVVGDFLVKSPEVDMVAFTGSKAVGLGINRAASSVQVRSGLKKVVAEMGGKNAIIVFPDADPDEAVKGVLLSAFEHANQKCSACSRVFIHSSIFDHFSRRLAHAVQSMPVGAADDPGTLMNPLIEHEARERVLAYVQKARAEGKVLVDRVDTGSSNPLLLGPLLVEIELAHLSRSTVAREEIFGPVLVLARFEDEREMLAQVNGTPYALTAGVFSRSPATVSRMITALRAGNIYVNRKITGARVGIEPFGGFQLSGTGPKAGGPEYLFAYLRRRQEELDSLERSDGAGVSLPPLAGTIEPWPANAARRVDVLKRCAGMLGKQYRGDLVHALQKVPGASPGQPAEELAERLLKAATAMVESAGEIAEAEATIVIPGQLNFIDWQMPRGKGFVATDDTASADVFAGIVFGALLAGNGLILAPGAGLQQVGDILARALHRAGVPRSVLGISPAGGPGAAVSLANDMFHFAATDMGLLNTHRVYERLGETREENGQTWVKALISMQDGRRPGEAGFVRQFALPRTIAIRTVRHEADLALPAVGSIPQTLKEDSKAC